MKTNSWHRTTFLLAAALALLACQNANTLTIRRTRDGQELRNYRLKSLTGIRDGDNLGTELVIGDQSSALTMQMRFKIGVPTKLESGSYVWRQPGSPQTQGMVKADTVIFQGGQDGPPALGGTFQLVVDNEVPLYKVKMPATPIDVPGKSVAPSK
jgi:hypothetical protein